MTVEHKRFRVLMVGSLGSWAWFCLEACGSRQGLGFWAFLLPHSFVEDKPQLRPEDRAQGVTVS